MKMLLYDPQHRKKCSLLFGQIFFESCLKIEAKLKKYLHAAKDFGYTFHRGGSLLILVV